MAPPTSRSLCSRNSPTQRNLYCCKGYATSPPTVSMRQAGYVVSRPIVDPSVTPKKVTRSGRGAEDQSHGGCHQCPGGDPPWEIDGGQPVPFPMLESRASRMPGHPSEKVGVRRMQQIPEVVVEAAQE